MGRLSAIMGAVALFIVSAASAWAQAAFPPHTVRLVVNSQAGGTVDVTVRIIADELAKMWHQAVIVDNVVGAGGNLGASQVARADPDGTTLLVSHAGPLTINPLLFKNLPYDPTKLLPITIIGRFPNLLVVSKALGVGSVQELIAYGKAHPGKITYGSQGLGTSTHLAGSLFGQLAGIDILHVPYRGSPAALLDLTGGRLDMMFDNMGTALPQHLAGTTRIIGVADDKRAALIPDVPTIEEAGLPGFRSIAWHGLMAPPGTSAALVAKINADVTAVLQMPAVKAQFARLNVETVGDAPDHATAFIAAETKLWSGVVRAAKITPE